MYKLSKIFNEELEIFEASNLPSALQVFSHFQAADLVECSLLQGTLII